MRRRGLLRGATPAAVDLTRDSRSWRKQCQGAVKRARRRIAESGWVNSTNCEAPTGGEGMAVDVALDAGTWRSCVDLHLRLFDPPVSLNATSVFGVDFSTYLQYQHPDAFEENMEASLTLVSLFIGGLNQA